MSHTDKTNQFGSVQDSERPIPLPLVMAALMENVAKSHFNLPDGYNPMPLPCAPMAEIAEWVMLVGETITFDEDEQLVGLEGPATGYSSTVVIQRRILKGRRTWPYGRETQRIACRFSKELHMVLYINPPPQLAKGALLLATFFVPT